MDKLSRETRVQTSGQTAIEKLENCIDAQSWWKEFVKCGEKFVEKLKASLKNFFKNFKKPLDKKETAWYNNKAVTKETAFHEREIFPIEESELIRQ